MQNHHFLSLRTQWFKLKAKDFIQRYAAGLLLIAILLPGVAIGDNLKVFLLALTQPLLIASSPNETFLTQMHWISTLLAVFLVWVKAQKTAINGGPFTNYLKSSALESKTLNRTNFLMILIANHFLWVFVLFGFGHLLFTDELPILQVIRYVLLISILIAGQYITIFCEKSMLIKKLSVIFLLLLVLTLPLSSDFEWFRIAILSSCLTWFVVFWINDKNYNQTFNPVGINTSQNTAKKNSKGNFYLQMLFKSSFSTTSFRILWMVVILIGFILASDHLKTINNDSLDPYAYILAALLAFFLSGFYLLFKDQRSSMKQLLVTLPIARFFWFKRDFLAVVLISTCLYLPYYFWHLNQFNQLTTIKAWAFHLFLLLLSYPLRTCTKEPTFSTFITLAVLTIVYIYITSHELFID